MVSRYSSGKLPRNNVEEKERSRCFACRSEDHEVRNCKDKIGLKRDEEKFF